MKILITGSAGNVGTQLVNALRGKHEIVTIDREPGTATYGIDLAVASESGRLEAIIAREQPQAIIHLAALLGGICDEKPDLARQINITATRTLAAAAQRSGVQRFIFLSTAALYQQTTLSPTDELSNINPRNNYGRTKLEAEEQITLLTKEKSSTQFITFRPFNIYGPRFTHSLVYNLIHSDTLHPVTLFGFHNLYRDYIHISDVIKAIGIALTTDQLAHAHSIINLGSDKALSNAALIDVLEKLGIAPTYTVASDEDRLDVSWADVSRIKELGFVPSSNIIIDRDSTL